MKVEFSPIWEGSSSSYSDIHYRIIDLFTRRHVDSIQPFRFDSLRFKLNCVMQTPLCGIKCIELNFSLYLIPPYCNRYHNQYTGMAATASISIEKFPGSLPAWIVVLAGFGLGSKAPYTAFMAAKSLMFARKTDVLRTYFHDEPPSSNILPILAMT
jgi:hypothetical protein